MARVSTLRQTAGLRDPELAHVGLGVAPGETSTHVRSTPTTLNLNAQLRKRCAKNGHSAASITCSPRGAAHQDLATAVVANGAARTIGVPVIAHGYAVLRTHAASEIPRLSAAPMMPGSAIIVSTA
jgi:hypothetical protein